MEESVNRSKPVHLNLTKMHFPPMAIVSILHRISGVVIFLGLPFLLYLLWASLGSQESFETLRQCLSGFWMQLAIWVMLSAVGFHFLAGIRHMLMDVGVGEQLCTAKASAYLVFALEVILVALLGAWLWV